MSYTIIAWIAISLQFYLQSLCLINVYLNFVLSLLTFCDPCHMWLSTPANFSVDRFILHEYLLKPLHCLLAAVSCTYIIIVITNVNSLIYASFISLICHNISLSGFLIIQPFDRLLCPTFTIYFPQMHVFGH